MNLSELKKKAGGKNIILCGSGPSLNEYAKKTLEGVHIALNKAFLKREIAYDAVISADYTAIATVKDELQKRDDLIKIFGCVPGPSESIIPPEFFGMQNVLAFDVADRVDGKEIKGEFTYDIENNAVRFAQSIAIAALQIILYLQPKRIYLVGLDFSKEGHFDNSYDSQFEKERHQSWVDEYWSPSDVRALWKRLAKFVQKYYADIEVISVNPITLKSIFKDVYIKNDVPKITAYIPVKANSVRLPGKNMLPFADSNLLINKIRQLKNVGNVSNIIVSTDSKEMLKMAADEGVIGIERPVELANESRPYAEFVKYLAEVLPGEHIMRCPVTAPLCGADVICDSIEKYFEALKNGYDSLTSVTRFQNHMMDESGPMNFSTGVDHKGSQNLPVWYEIANCMDIEPKKVMEQYCFQYGPKVFRYEVEPITAIDIDELTDYRIACAIYEYWEKNDII